VIGVFTAPTTLTWALGGAVAIDTSALLLPMMGTLVVVQLFPLLAGMVVKRRAPAVAERFAAPLTRVANGVLLAVIVGLLWLKGGVLFEMGATVVALCVGLVLANLALGAVFSPGGPARRSVSLITGVRNVSLALLLSAGWFPDPQTDATILVFGLFAMLLPFAISQGLGRWVAGR
jgi:BASS family bile acid:Na+ symporter